MYKIGDKFIVEIDSVFTNDKGTKLYRIKGFNSLIFDENGLKKLDPYKPAEKKTNNDKFKEVFGIDINFDEVMKDPISFIEWAKKEYKEDNKCLSDDKFKEIFNTPEFVFKNICNSRKSLYSLNTIDGLKDN